MEEKIKKLYENINFIGYYCMYHRKNDYIEKAKSLLPDVQEFVQWFLAGNQFGIEEEIYQKLQRNLISVLQDITEALKQKDRVLMLDALEFGISEYLAMFLPEEYFEEKRNANERVTG